MTSKYQQAEASGACSQLGITRVVLAEIKVGCAAERLGDDQFRESLALARFVGGDNAVSAAGFGLAPSGQPARARHGGFRTTRRG